MIRSMTGFGAAKGTASGLALSVELRSVNNRYLDLGIKLPRGFLFAESFVKSFLQERIGRGKVDVFFTLDLDEGDRTRIRVNEKLAQAYYDAVGGIGGLLELPAGLSALDIARFPDVLTAEKLEVNQEQFCEGLRPLLEAAVSDFNCMREREGEKIREDLLKKADRMEDPKPAFWRTASLPRLRSMPTASRPMKRPSVCTAIFPSSAACCRRALPSAGSWTS